MFELLPPVEEILDPLLNRLGFVQHGHGFVFQGRFSHAVINILVLLEHPQLHLCLHAHRLWGKQSYQRITTGISALVM